MDTEKTARCGPSVRQSLMERAGLREKRDARGVHGGGGNFRLTALFVAPLAGVASQGPLVAHRIFPAAAAGDGPLHQRCSRAGPSCGGDRVRGRPASGLLRLEDAAPKPRRDPRRRCRDPHRQQPPVIDRRRRDRSLYALGNNCATIKTFAPSAAGASC